MCTDQKYPALRLDKKRHGFKIIITGEYSVGKSSLAMKYYSESNKSNMTKHDLRHYLTTLHIDGNAIELHIYDTAGQERYRSLTKSYYRGVHGCLIVFDTTKSDTFYKVQTWLDDLDHYSTEPEKISRIVVGTNCFSPEREIDKQTAQQFANHLEIDYMEVDIDYNVNVTDVFEKLTSLLIKNMHRSTFSHHQHNAEILVKDSIKGFKTSCIC